MSDKPNTNGDGLRSLQMQIAELAKTQNEKVVPTLAAIEAKLEIKTEQHDGEISALFAGRREHENRLAKIEQSYVPREHCERIHDREVSSLREQNQANVKEHDEFRGQIRGLDISVGKLVTISSLVAGGVSAITHMALYLLKVKGG